MISISDLTVADTAGRAVLDQVTLRVEPGDRVGIVGESGSGKTTLATALLGAIRPGLRAAGGTITFDGRDVLSLGERELRALRRDSFAYLGQDPATALTPTMRVGRQIAELATDPSPKSVARHLEGVGLPGDRVFQRRFPHQLSGGQQQRLALARAMAGEPAVLILDEPTTGLDVITQALVLTQIEELAAARGITLLFITHDLIAAARLSDRLVVLRSGRVVEDGPLAATLTAPKHPYTAELVAAVPDIAEAFDKDTPARASAPLLEVRDLVAGHGRGRRKLTTSDGVSFQVARGECVALLGASGSGKTTIARCVSGHHRPDSGQVLVDGEVMPVNVRDRTLDQRRKVQLVPQDSAGSLNPRRTVGAAIARPLRVLQGMDKAAAETETTRLLSLVGLPAEMAARYPRQLSGGQRQRVTIARALAAKPELLVCDEITSSLDVRVQAGVLDLVAELSRTEDLAVVLITHDLGVIARMADRVLSLRAGVVAEQGTVHEVLGAPRHEWTAELVAAVPSLRTELANRTPRKAGAA
ncbi:ABC transporter ATP-binding protein [Actinokineospora iranica]|uniref:Peptide/nickel transport system ATP-binding protein n=1 Tax=Actinokineospora iranica TaxID=1271860 RepID=A0A1G6W8U3_9PSEU|nr:ABC transporter ATP-binding protein [Actinokineospora iranica]SDD62234.1 peptide/nickel transport system ATP-binding protein [Actinokineospora iranica]